MGIQRDPTFLLALARKVFSPRGMHVLIVDPDVPGSRALAAALGRRHTVAFASTLVMALEAIAHRTPALVVTELDLPDGQGLTLISTLKARPATRNVLVIALTNRAAVNDKIAALRSGTDDYLVKPVDPRTFADHIQRLSQFHHLLPTLAQ